MDYKVLTPSFLESNNINSLRHELCEIIYADYKGRTFSLEQKLEDKKDVLSKIQDFIKNHPEIAKYKEDSTYWYPYKDVDGSDDLSLHSHYYPNKEGEITYFCKKGENAFDKTDYLFDPVKLQFFLMCSDIAKMECDRPNAKEIVEINDTLFKILFETIGDTVSYNGLNTLEHIQKYIQKNIDGEIEVRDNQAHSEHYKNMLINSYKSFNDFSHLLNKAIIICNADKLSKELPTNDELKRTKKKI